MMNLIGDLQVGSVYKSAQQVRVELYAERREILLSSQAQSHRRYAMWRTRRYRRLRIRPMFGKLCLFEFIFLMISLWEWLGEWRD